MVTKETYLVAGGAAVLSFVAGGGTAYLVLRKRIEEKYDKIMHLELERFYTAILEEKDEEEHPVMQTYDPETEEFTTVEDPDESLTYETVIVENEYLESVPEVSETDAYQNTPYIISNETFFQNTREYDQSTLTYYEGDDILVDEIDEPIQDPDMVVGEANLSKFGHGSKDNNIVYVRNDVLGLDFEVVRRHGKYAQEVLGYIEHSDKRGPRKFRVYD